MVDKTNLKKDGVKSSSKKSAVKKPVPAPAVNGSADIINRAILFDESSINNDVIKECVGAPRPLFSSALFSSEPIAVPSLDDLDSGVDCDDLIMAGAFASIVSSGDGIKDKFASYRLALNAYTSIARIERVLIALNYSSKKYAPLLALLPDEKARANIKALLWSLATDSEIAMRDIRSIVHGSLYDSGDCFKLCNVNY